MSLCAIDDPDCDPLRLRAVDVRNGSGLPWSPEPPRGSGDVDSVALVAGNVIAAGSGYVVAFDERTALRRWSLRLGRNGDAATVRGLATAAGRLLAGGAFARNLVEIDPRRGVVKPWRLPHRPSHGRLTPLPGRATIVGLGGGRLYLAGNVRYPLRLGSSNLASLELATRRVKAVPRVAKFQSIGRIAGLRRHVLAAGLFAVKFR